MRTIVCVCCAVVLCATVPADEPQTTPSEETTLWDDAVALYQKARDTGEKVPSDIYEWVRQDLHNIGDWEYRVVSFEKAALQNLEQELNELGTDRWECFWVDSERTRATFYFKRPTRSYLKTLPLGDLLKLVPSDSPSE